MVLFSALRGGVLARFLGPVSEFGSIRGRVSMKKLTMCVFAAALAFVAATTCFAADSAWNGTWKENLAKSKLTGHHFVVTEKPGGMMHFSNGGPVSYDFACDGKPYTTSPGQVLTCTGNPQSGYDFTMSVNGHAVNKQHRTFSADGKEMIMKGTDYRADGSTADFSGVRKREGSGTGLVGTWVQAEVQDQKPDVQTWSVKGDRLEIQSSVDKVTIDAKLDGSDSTVAGPNVPPGATLAIKPEGANKLRFERKLNGKLMNEETYTLNADNKVMTEISWVPGRETEKVTVVYEKQ